MKKIAQKLSAWSFDRWFLLILLVIGIGTTFAYGVYYDQKSEQEILFANIKEYMVQFGIEDGAFMQDMNDRGIAVISENTNKYLGSALFYPAGVVWLINQVSPYAGSIFWHLYTFLMVFVGIVALYYLGRELFRSRYIAAFVTLLFFLTPRMFAESHYNNKDMVLLAIVFVLFYLAIRLMKEPVWKNVLLYAIAGAFATNIRIIGAYFWGLLGVYAVAQFVGTKRFHKDIALKVLVCILVWFGCYLFITPSCWADLVGHLEYMISSSMYYNIWGNYFLYDGQLFNYSKTGMPRFYLIKMILYTVPLEILVLIGVGGLFALLHLVRRKDTKQWWNAGFVLVILIMGAFPVLWATIKGTSLYNGWRHFYFVYAAMIVGAGYGVYCLNEMLGRWIPRKVRLSGAGLYVMIGCLLLAWNYPYNNCYYNALAGQSVETTYELDYWNLSIWQAHQAILKDAPKEGVISVSAFNDATGHGVGSNWENLPQAQRDRIAVLTSGQWKDADYVIVNMTYAMIFNPTDYEWLQECYTLVEAFKSYGNVICEVYKKR